MYLNNQKIEEIFNAFSGNFVGSNSVLTLERFAKAINSITDASHMLIHEDYISLPDLRNKLGIAAHISGLIDMNSSGNMSDEELINELKLSNNSFKESIKTLTQKK